MLTEEEKEHINEEINKYPQKQYAALDALLIVQEKRGYINDDTLNDIADYLNISSTQLDGVATFYNLIYRKEVGKNIIHFCDSVSCFINGAEKIKKEIKNYLQIDFGQTTKDKQFTLLRAQCLGACDKAPIMMINQHLHTHLDLKKIIEILKVYKEGIKHAPSIDESNEKKWSTTESERVSG